MLTLTPVYTQTWLDAQRLADLIASDRSALIAAEGPGQLAGVVSGPGNQGTANTAHMAGQAGTAGTFLSLPRQLHFGNAGAKPQ